LHIEDRYCVPLDCKKGPHGVLTPPPGVQFPTFADSYYEMRLREVILQSAADRPGS
jgi:hypothetical protein